MKATKAARKLRHRAAQLRKMADEFDAVANDLEQPEKPNGEVAVQHNEVAEASEGEAQP